MSLFLLNANILAADGGDENSSSLFIIAFSSSTSLSLFDSFFGVLYPLSSSASKHFSDNPLRYQQLFIFFQDMVMARQNLDQITVDVN